MSDSPYRSPPLESSETPSSDGSAREALRRVAKYQRWVLFALLGNIGLNIVAVATAEQSPPVRLAVLAVALCIVAFAVTAVFLLARELINIGVAVVCAVLMIVPCVSLIMLLVVNQKATSYLQKHGIKVGFMGVDPNRI